MRKRAQLSMCDFVVAGASASELAMPWKNCRSPKWLRAVMVSNLPFSPSLKCEYHMAPEL